MARILLVDDNVELLKIQELILGEQGHEVSTASDGRDALALFEHEFFDLVITDLIMPDKEGFEVIMELSSRYPGTRIIAMSGGGRISATDYLPIARVLGANATLTKPVSQGQLLAMVDQVLGQMTQTDRKVCCMGQAA